VALGASLFSLDYRATLDRQAGDHASFVAGAEWRVSERGRHNSLDVTPLTRFRRVSAEQPTPTLRLNGTVEDVATESGTVAATVVAFPAGKVARLRGWRNDFSALSRAELAQRLRPSPVHMSGLRLSADARRLRVRARGQTDYPRRLV